MKVRRTSTGFVAGTAVGLLLAIAPSLWALQCGERPVYRITSLESVTVDGTAVSPLPPFPTPQVITGDIGGSTGALLEPEGGTRQVILHEAQR